MPVSDAAALSRYEDLRAQGQDLLRRGKFPKALEVFEGALSLARSLGDADVFDRAVCNRCRVAIEMGRTADECGELAKVLLRNRDPETQFFAAYNLSRAYQVRKESERAISYAAKARQFAELLGRPELMASAHNQRGVSLLAASYFDEALEEFRSALSLLSAAPTRRRGALLDNLGYCLVVRGEIRNGLVALYESWRTLRRLGEQWVEMAPRLSLCYAYLELEKSRAALRHGKAALELSEKLGDHATSKASLYLLGEAAKQAGDKFLARRYFQRLQESYYPDNPDLIDMLLVIDARTLVNLKA